MERELATEYDSDGLERNEVELGSLNIRVFNKYISFNLKLKLKVKY
jgi:hypothetical protein